MRCWLSQWSSKPCEGRMDKAHLISRQVIRRELRLPRRERFKSEAPILWDERFWVWACRRCHADWDNYRFDVPRSALSPELEALAEDLGLGPALDRRFGPKEQVVSQSTIA